MAKILLTALAFILISASGGEKFLKIPKEAIKEIALELKDPLSGRVQETYLLERSRTVEFIDQLNLSKEAPALKMNITCYQLRVSYIDGRKILLPTNGKGLGPTEVGYFLSAENLVFKYFPISRQNFCKPQNADTKSGGGFGF